MKIITCISPLSFVNIWLSISASKNLHLWIFNYPIPFILLKMSHSTFVVVLYKKYRLFSTFSFLCSTTSVSNPPTMTTCSIIYNFELLYSFRQRLSISHISQISCFSISSKFILQYFIIPLHHTSFSQLSYPVLLSIRKNTISDKLRYSPDIT